MIRILSVMATLLCWVLWWQPSFAAMTRSEARVLSVGAMTGHQGDLLQLRSAANAGDPFAEAALGRIYMIRVFTGLSG
jgi:hypothetical protein